MARYAQLSPLYRRCTFLSPTLHSFAGIFIYVRAQLSRIRRRKGETIAGDVCRRSLRSHLSLKRTAISTFFPRDCIPQSSRCAAAFLPSVSCNLFFRYQLKLQPVPRFLPPKKSGFRKNDPGNSRNDRFHNLSEPARTSFVSIFSIINDYHPSSYSDNKH